MSAYPYPPPNQPGYFLDPAMVTTALELPGYRIVRNVGVVRGIIVRSRNIFATIGAGLQTILGGNITLYTQLCEKTRQDAFAMMMQHAARARRQRHHHGPLRRQRADAGSHRSSCVRNCRSRRKNLTRPPSRRPYGPCNRYRRHLLPCPRSQGALRLVCGASWRPTVGVGWRPVSLGRRSPTYNWQHRLEHLPGGHQILRPRNRRGPPTLHGQLSCR